MFFTVTKDAHKCNKLHLARSNTRVIILKTPRGIVVVNSYKILLIYNRLFTTPFQLRNTIKDFLQNHAR